MVAGSRAEKAWQRKAAHIIIARKEKVKEEPRRKIYLCRSCIGDLLCSSDKILPTNSTFGSLDKMLP